MMNKKRIVKLCCFGLVFLLFLGGVSAFFQVNSFSDGLRIKGFYLEPENSLDVVTIGASETYTAIAPGMLWDEYGFTSYDFSTAGSPIAIVKSQVKEVLKHQKPKLIVIELNGALQKNDSYQTDENRLRKYIDNMPWSENKVETISELIPKKEQINYFVPFLKYHSNWQSWDMCLANFYVQTRMRLEGGSGLKGFQTYTDKTVASSEVLDVTNDRSTLSLTDMSEYYLRDLLQYLKDEKIDNVLFIRIPHRITKKTYPVYQRANEAEKIIKEYGFSYVDFETQKEAIGLDMTEDFYNDHHMNLYGQEKFTKYFGKYLVEHYGLSESEHSETVVKAWDRAAGETDECISYTRKMLEKKKKATINEGWKELKKYDLDFSTDKSK